jgi:hypothetical protein
MPLENAVRRPLVDIYINVAIVVMSINDTIVVVIDTALPAKTPRKKSACLPKPRRRQGFWQGKLH